MNEYPIIGMSPGNSYFKEEVVKQLLKTVVEKFGRTAVLVADIPAIFTYVALGYPKNRARKDKALPQGNNLKNKVKRAMEELGYSETQVKIIDWEKDVENNPDYQEEYNRVVNLYETNQTFRQTANDATQEVLEGSTKETIDLKEAVKIGVHYLLSEFGFMEFAPKYFGVEKVTYVYHRRWPVYESYRLGEFDGTPRPYLDSLVVTTD